MNYHFSDYLCINLGITDNVLKNVVLISSHILITKKSKQINTCTSEILPRKEINSPKNILVSKQNYDNILRLRCIDNFINIFFLDKKRSLNTQPKFTKHI